MPALPGPVSDGPSAGRLHPAGDMAEEHLGLAGAGIAVQHKPDSGLGRPPRKATTRRMAKLAYAGCRVLPMARPKRNGGAPD